MLKNYLLKRFEQFTSPTGKFVCSHPQAYTRRCPCNRCGHQEYIVCPDANCTGITPDDTARLLDSMELPAPRIYDAGH
jgi:hypothetical protein